MLFFNSHQLLFRTVDRESLEIKCTSLCTKHWEYIKKFMLLIKHAGMGNMFHYRYSKDYGL